MQGQTSAKESPRPLLGGTAWSIIATLWILFVSSLIWPRFKETESLQNAVWIWAVIALFSLATAWLKNGRTAPKISVSIRAPHYVQMLVQGSVFAYWGWYWEPVYNYVPLILSQVVFAYLMELAVCWFKYGKWRIGFGPWPIVFSTNLFMWFIDAHFWVQYVLIALAYLSREGLRWKRDGVESHIFNPSAFGLCVVSLVLIATELPHLTHGEEISVSLGYPPYAYHFIFAAGLVVQFFFGVTMVTMSAAITSWILGAIYLQMTGGYMYVDTTIPIAVFLGMNLLVTDPASSPRSHGGKLLFGLLYGLAIFFMYAVLRDAGEPAMGDDPGFSIAWMDKLLFLPLLNLLAHPIDRIGRHLRLGALTEGWSNRRIHMSQIGVWAVAFVWLLPGLTEHPGQIEFWANACQEDVHRACENELILHKVQCERGVAESCSKVAMAHRYGEYLPKDMSRASGYQVEACRSGSSQHCTDLFEMGVYFWESVNMTNALSYADQCFEMACEKSVLPACLARGCLSGHDPQNCTQLGELFRLGKDVDKAPERAFNLYAQACEMGEQRGCERLCQDGVTLACHMVADLQCKAGVVPACEHLRRLGIEPNSVTNQRK